MKLWLKWTSLLVVVIGLITVVTLVHQKHSRVSGIPTNPQVGYHIPDFTLPIYGKSGQTISIKHFSGRPMFINVFASWCPPCQVETPELVKAYKEYGNKVQFIGVNLTSQDSLGAVQNFIEKYHIQYPVGLDRAGRVGVQLKVVAIPTSFFIDGNGVIIARYSGAIPKAQLDSNLQQLSK
jgi:cytochrome c biogenesis protein CcmG/thiol:disulfide interchange protein DsbE